MRPVLRWSVAVLVTIAAFAAATWTCGAFVLTMRDSAVRWGIAGGAGVAVAALAALWGHSYASAESPHPTPEQAHSAPASTSSTSNKIRGGTFHRPVMQGRDFGTVNLAAPGTGEPTQTPPSASDDLPAEGP
jgi:hypothetical protein